ncbi:transcription factor domain-containing protein [Aspergillus undulatus]|uniref:transcription factor domain-containing protein n=1 Tax=Aspergillus undulatus TaxID=1810928 RepID=UPI003CCD5B23
MFVTFAAGQDPGSNPKQGPRNPKQPRRSDRIGRRGIAPRACTSCRRRKTKCDGKQPCEACQWYKKPELCYYLHRPSPASRREPAIAPSHYQDALERLFPDTDPETLVNLSREEMLDVVASQKQGSPATAASIGTHASVLSIKRPDLEGLHSMPGEIEQPDHSQSVRGSDPAAPISDDVNALSLTTRHSTSYLGVSSIQAALKVIAWLHPEFETHFTRTLFKDDNTPQLRSDSQHTSPPTEMEMLDAYFVNFHPFAPLLDEEAFRATLLAGSRNDDQWLALLNIVLSLGSIAAAGADDQTHRLYFDRSMSRLNVYSLGSPSLEVVQALGLIGGWYCHYISQPNLGYSLMGASLRMAVTLGLQREPCVPSHFAVEPTSLVSQELRRRIWWSLSCLETWGHETLGRPNMDCFGPSITVNPPRALDKESYLRILPLTENIQYAKISSKIQESLAALPTLTPTEMCDLDSQLLQWWENLPPILKFHQPCPQSLYAVRTVMRWRFYNQRILLHRPILLNFAMRRVPFNAVRVEERGAIEKCHRNAEALIQDISGITELNQVIGWNAVWLLFQGAMIPLILLSTSPADDDSPGSFDTCKALIEAAILTLGRMRPYSRTAEASLHVVTRFFEAILHGSDQSSGVPAGNNASIEPFPPLDPTNALDGATAAFFDGFWPHHVVDYLSWDANNLWPELPNMNPQSSEALSLFNPTAEGI